MVPIDRGSPYTINKVKDAIRVINEEATFFDDDPVHVARLTAMMIYSDAEAEQFGLKPPTPIEVFRIYQGLIQGLTGEQRIAAGVRSEGTAVVGTRLGV